MIAMANERLRLPGHVEISAVCAHSGHRGYGLVRMLITVLVQDAFGRGLAPLLHVIAEDTETIEAYRKMGFAPRKVMHLAIIKLGEADIP